jgi:surface protein
MWGMFAYCKNFNFDLSKWDVSNVKDMEDMFVACTSLKNKPAWYWYKE